MAKKKSRKNRNKRKRQQQEEKSGMDKNTMVMGAILAIILGYWGLSQLGGNDFPEQITGVFYSDPVVSSETGRVTVPEDVVKMNKLTFVDLKLDNRTEGFTYMGREIDLTTYRDAEYLPLIIISTPKGKTISGIRVCEPCLSFSFQMIEGKYLRCDICGTRWDIETLQGIDGGCMNYPPPKLTTGILNGVVIEAGSTGLDY
ncbi:DUF2318 domain-containing protein [Candidatus Bathyarchaeota archaeon]|nr:DUF2318 domain-containing protein [Candidatus Bathyarchaeota archaeon]MBT4320149.1 DUF2318 domain-containing protein [Candidatus Bathyarchaeota archaeon]MBT4424797.1 DUF2318 domain-containing protein [Candidatus Bathyarchaeota archaeon]MBT5643049.1 DUF2318 domain-containing protein [Candidatus Bathyarchaeota archaeon]MBT6603909.1 DUF2318 domain-containing protein [Candidatus Bathyarchaeota archaeon]